MCARDLSLSAENCGGFSSARLAKKLASWANGAVTLVQELKKKKHFLIFLAFVTRKAINGSKEAV